MSALQDLNILPNKKVMHLVLTAYANVGDTVGAEKVFERMLSMGFSATSDTINIILKSIVNSVGDHDLDWEAINFCYSEYFGFQKFVADTETYTQLLNACENYNHPEQAVIWFNELLSVGMQITPEMRDCLLRCIGEETFKEYTAKLHPDYQQVMSEIDIQVTTYQPKQLSPTSAHTRSSRPDNQTVSRNATSRSRNIHHRDEGFRNKSDVKSYVIRDPNMLELNDVAERGDVAGTQSLIRNRQAEGSIPTSVLLEHLVYAHMKALDTKGAQEVVNSMKLLNVDVSRKSYQHLTRSYSNDGDGAGAERVMSESVMSGHAIGTYETRPPISC